MENLQICQRCVMDTTDPEIKFDERGICNHCKTAEQALNRPPLSLSPMEKEAELLSIIHNIKTESSSKKYDCIIGLSGGVDSTYVAYKVVELGLRPLAIHFDNTWNSTIAEANNDNICSKLHIDLFRYKVEWNEFRNLELAFLKASTPDLEITSDHGIVSLLNQQAAKNNLSFIISGLNSSTESILPPSWSRGHYDWKYIKSVNKTYSRCTLKAFPHTSFTSTIFYRKIRKIKWLHILNYLNYNKSEAKELITKELGWQDYGGKHYESIITKFWQGYILPVKFGFDKRKAHLSSLIISGQITREQALEELKHPAYPPEELENDIRFFCSKMEISLSEFRKIMKSPPKTFWDYSSYEKTWYYVFLNYLWKLIKRPKGAP